MQSTNILSFLLICIVITASTSCAIACDDSDDDLSDSQVSEVSSTPDYSIESIYVECNDSFITTMEYLETLNQTGRFPEESDKTPLCFLRCFLHKSGIYDEMENVIGERAVEIGWVDSEQTIDECMEQMVGSPCQKAYQLVRCVTEHNLKRPSD
ncbi:general odorant-binding protein 84a-like [Aedes aegypti]|uniref:Uncharacterized protein n=1 Tax=Aedes aegypti TaxID=7159 RepID=A0A1S4G7D2_AEDAE|nr:general odorant-binding protein 84a-like [Aedes aegypti]